MSELTQISDVLKHLQEKGSITSAEAIAKYGATRLSGIIYKLRKDGYEIDSVIERGITRHNRPCKYARYVYRGTTSCTQ